MTTFNDADEVRKALHVLTGRGTPLVSSVEVHQVAYPETLVVLQFSGLVSYSKNGPAGPFHCEENITCFLSKELAEETAEKLLRECRRIDHLEEDL